MADLSRTVEHVYAGPFSTATLAAMGVVLAAVMGLLMWREGRIARFRLMLPLFALRVAAAIVVLWMLAGPVQQTTVAHTRPKSVGILVDASQSMSVVDRVDGDSEAIRWAAAHEASGRAGLLVEMDAAAICLAAARAHFNRFADVCRGKGRAEWGRQAAVQTLESVQAAVGYLEKVVRRLRDDYSITNDELQETLSTLTDGVLPELESLGQDIENDRFLLAPDREARIEEMAAWLDTLPRRTARQADGLAAWYARQDDPATLTRVRAQAGMSRLEKVAQLLDAAQRSWLADLEQHVRVIRYRFDGSVFPVAVDDWIAALSAARDGTAAATNLTGALEQVARDSAIESLAAVIMLTDGGHNAGSDPVAKAAAVSGVPAFVVPIGNTKPLRDVMLHHVQGPRAVLQNDLIVIDAIVDAHGCAGEELTVDLLKDDQVVDSQQIAVSSDSFVRRLTFAHKAETMGMQEFRLQVHAVPDERIGDNNEAKLSVEVTEDKIRVLLADHLPRWEFRYLRNLFKRAESIEFDELLFESTAGGQEQAPEAKPKFPKDLDAWGRYRVVILGDIRPSDLTATQQDLLEQFVDRRAGTLVLIAGKDAMPEAYLGGALEKMLPVQATKHPPPDRERGYSLFVTAAGRFEPMTQLADDPVASDRFWREQFSSRFPIYDLSPFSQPKPASTVLIGAVPVGSGEPISDVKRAMLCWHKYGRGRVVYLSAPVTYRLRYRHGDRPHQLFWEQLLRWAIAREVAGGSKSVRLGTDKTRYRQGDEVRVTARLNRLDGEEVTGARCRVIARRDDKIIATEEMEEDEDVPGTYGALFKELPEGPVTIEVAGPDVQALLAEEEYLEPVTTAIVVDPPDSLEMRNTRCNLPLLKRIAESTGGLIVPPTALATAVVRLDLSPEVSEEISQVPLWTRWMCLWIFLGCLTAEWVARKLTGLA